MILSKKQLNKMDFSNEECMKIFYNPDLFERISIILVLPRITVYEFMRVLRNIEDEEIMTRITMVLSEYEYSDKKNKENSKLVIPYFYPTTFDDFKKNETNYSQIEYKMLNFEYYRTLDQKSLNIDSIKTVFSKIISKFGLNRIISPVRRTRIKYQIYDFIYNLVNILKNKLILIYNGDIQKKDEYLEISFHILFSGIECVQELLVNNVVPCTYLKPTELFDDMITNF